ASGATRASAMFRPRCLLKNSANNHRRLETRVSAIDSTPHHSRLGNVPPALFAEKFSKQPQAA
ncbi:hypothetical protein, partial [Janthinobacterium sp. MDT1-19]|uniref:hypothetical protein n=1 Tax=Janthinobacterium sp. MDT1-19 TaxID=1259339 RepID=UPI003F24AD63